MALANKLVPDERANGNGEASGNENKSALLLHMGHCQKYAPFLGPYYNTGPNTGPNLGDPKRDHSFDNPSHTNFLINFAVLGTPHQRAKLGATVCLKTGPCEQSQPCVATFFTRDPKWESKVGDWGCRAPGVGRRA